MSDNQDQHEFLSQFRDLAAELGRAPTRAELEQKIRGGRYKLDKYFGGQFAVLLQAAGLQPSKHSRAKISNDIFRREIGGHLELYRAKELEAQPKVNKADWPHAAIISDIHWPFHHQKTIDRFFLYLQKEKPKYVIIAGDAWDLYSHAKFPRSHNVFTPKDEELLARKLNEDFWREVKRLVPDAFCFQLLGNHDVRPLKRTIELMPTVEHWIAEVFKRLFTFDGVETVFDPRQELFLPGDIMVHHGYRSKLGDHRDYALYSAIVGHTHRPGIVWRKVRGSQIFEMNCGLAGDPLAKGLTYTAQRLVDWCNAFGVIDEDGPRNIIV